MKPLFSLRKLSFSYDEKIIFDNIDLEIFRNEVIIISGENGSGKTTLCKILYKMLSAGSDSILFEEKLLSAVDQSYIASKIVFVQEQVQNNLLGSTPDEDLAIWQHKFQKKDSKEFQEERARILERFGLDTVQHKPLWEFSEGQQKRAVLSGLLLNKHKFWLLDEPLYGLDNKGVNILISIIAQQKLAGAGALIATHRPKAFSLVADIVLEISNRSVHQIVG
ncbi:MAG TPA: ATP-binding cassette domain-containing protein [Candidatus Cloacimonetes bacterium]|nr:ATP-binding cassette domain-containing protein [Candidatus Cloacimonadota bacterium]